MKNIRHVETWTRHIKKLEDYEEIPSDLRAVYETNAGEYNPDIYMLYCPPDERAGIEVSEKLLYIFDVSLICIEKEHQKLTLKKFKAEHIQVLEIGFVLLDGWMVVAGKCGDKNEIITVYYNHVIYLFFEKIIEILRAMALGLKYPLIYDNTVSDLIQDESFNFMNYTRGIILKSPAEYVFQRAINGKRFKFFPVTFTNDHLMLLTKSEFIRISEGRYRGRGKTDKYGHTNTFYIRKYMDKPKDFTDEDSGLLSFRLSSGAYCHRALFDKDNASDAIALLSKL